MTTRLAAVLGWPVAHSRSPALHGAAFAATGLDATMLAFAVAPDAIATAVRGLAALGCLGASVTVPHKAAVMAACDAIDHDARAIGAVNCLAFDGGRVTGHNTDAGGFVDALVEVDGARGPAIVLGAGGAARAVVAGLASTGIAATVFARRPDAATWGTARPWHELASALPHTRLLVDCTSAGLDDVSDRALAASVPLAPLPDDAVVATLVYHRPTALCLDAAARGLRTLDGRAMLLHQAARAFTIWTGRLAPIAAMRAALDRSLR